MNQIVRPASPEDQAMVARAVTRSPPVRAALHGHCRYKGASRMIKPSERNYQMGQAFSLSKCGGMQAVQLLTNHRTLSQTSPEDGTMPMIIGYHASHEQFAPSDLLTYVQVAEDAGFQAIMTSDHISPWLRRQGNSGNNWAWLGAAMAKTSLPFGSLAIPGGWRYHPAVLAHLVATVGEMFPGRLRWIAMGSGEALNEHVVGGEWPAKAERNARLQAGTEIIRRLLRGEEVDWGGRWFAVDKARLWSLPATPPALFAAALSEETAQWAGEWSDGLVTINKPKQKLVDMVEGYRSGGGQGKPLALQVQVSWAETEASARAAAFEEWRNAALPPASLADLPLPEDFERTTRHVKPEDIDEVIPLVTAPATLLEIISAAEACGFEQLFIHNVSRDQIGFLQFMKRQIFPALRISNS
jgi:coenzyme F420-dependent glucose-6-phosphate dehydrogenase